MSEDFALALVRICGGFWSYRERLLRQRAGIWRGLLRAVYYLYLQRYGAYIGHSARIASEPCFPHNLNGIFIAGGARIGQNCVIFHQVTIGANALPDSKGVGSPEVKDNVYIGAGAKLIGAITIGHNCRIGANCVVTKDVPDNATVLLPGPVVVEHAAPPDNRYFRWSPNGPLYFRSGKWILETDPETIQSLRTAL